MVNCLNSFCSFSGQKVNYQKSSFYTSANVGSPLINEIRRIFGMNHCDDLGMYLGVPLHSQMVNKCTYYYLLEKNKKRLVSWKENQLSLVERATLVQSVTSSIATYTMQSTK